MSRQQFGSANNSTKVLSFQKSGATASFDPNIIFSSGSGRVSWRLNNGSGIKQVAGNSIIYTGFTGDSNLRTIEMRGSSFKNINQFYLPDENLYGNLNLSPIPNISGIIRMENNPLLTGITHSPSSGTISSYQAQSCNLTGILDISMINTYTYFNVSSNPNLTQIIHNPTGSTTSNYISYGCNLTGHHNMSMISGLSFCWLWNNPSLTGVTHGYSNANFIQYWVSSCNLTGNHDLTMFPNLGGYFNVAGNNNLTGITHTASTNVFTSYIAYNGLVGNLDLSMLSGLGGIIGLANNPNLTGITLPISTQPIQGFEIPSCNITGTLSLSGFSSLGSISSATTSTFKFYSNSNLNNILFPIGDGYLSNDANNAINAAIGLFSCNLGYVDFKPLSGCTILSGATVGLPRFELFDNVMTTADVNRVLSDFDLISTLNYSGWTATSGTTGGYINISLNSAPDGSSGGFNGTGATVNLVSKGWTVITD